MILEIKNTTQFKKDLKRFLHRKSILEDLKNVIADLANGVPLDPVYRDHSLVGNWVGYRECHIRGDLLLVYKVSEVENILYLAAFGSHSEVLKM